MNAVFEMDATRKKMTEPLDAPAPDARAVTAIGKALQAHYTELVHAPLPDRFVDLLARLEQDAKIPEQGRRDADG
jgi:Anti-sigma factor NepR